MQLDNKRILIIKPSSLGDIVHTLPVVHALKRCFPSCSIGWIVQQGFASLIKSVPSVDTVYPIHIPATSDPLAGRWAYFKAFKALITTLWELRCQFNDNSYDFILDLQGSFRSGLLGRTNPGGMRIGFKDARELNSLFQQELVTVPDNVQHALQKNLSFCDHLHVKVADEDFNMDIRSDFTEVKSFLHQHGIAADSKIIYANSATRWQTKFWPIQHWAKLADRFFEQGIVLIFGGSGQDEAYIKSITQLMDSQPVIAAGRFTLPQSVTLIQHSTIYVGVDSGPMHIAALSGIPVVALFGPTHPSRVGPYGVKHYMARAEGLDCLECRKRTCKHLSCMKEITVEKVYDAAMSFIDSKIEKSEQKK